MPNVADKNSLECPWETVPRELLKFSEVILLFCLLYMLEIQLILQVEHAVLAPSIIFSNIRNMRTVSGIKKLIAVPVVNVWVNLRVQSR